MILRTLLIFLILLASIYIGIHLQHDPGYVLIVMHHWIIETTVWVALAILMLAMLLFHVSLLTFHKIIHIPTAWHDWRTARRAQKAQAKTRQGLIEFSEGYWQKAKKHLINALPDADTPLLNYLTAARAAQEMGDNTLRDNYLRQAQQTTPEAKVAVELTQAQLQLANQQWEQALATLRHLQDLVPHHPYVLKLLMQLYEEMGDWTQLIALLPTLKRYEVITGPSFDELQHRAFLQALQDLIKQDQAAAITALVTSLPKELKHDAILMASYADYLIKNQQDKQAEATLRSSLQKQLDEKLINLYGQLTPDVIQLNFIETLLKKNPHSAAINLCLGRIGIAKQLWGKARAHLEESIRLHPTTEAYVALGNLLEQLNDEPGACLAYKQGCSVVLPADKKCPTSSLYMTKSKIPTYCQPHTNASRE